MYRLVKLWGTLKKWENNKMINYYPKSLPPAFWTVTLTDFAMEPLELFTFIGKLFTLTIKTNYDEPWCHRFIFIHRKDFNFFSLSTWRTPVNHLITDEVSVPEMRIWSILLIKSDLKMVYTFGRNLFLNFNYLVSVTALEQRVPRAHVAKFYGRFLWIHSLWRSSIFPCFKIHWNCNFVG